MTTVTKEEASIIKRFLAARSASNSISKIANKRELSSVEMRKWADETGIMRTLQTQVIDINRRTLSAAN